MELRPRSKGPPTAVPKSPKESPKLMEEADGDGGGGDILVVQQPTGTGETPEKPYYYQLSKCVNCSKSIHKLESSVQPGTGSSSTDNDSSCSSQFGSPVSSATTAMTFTDLTRQIKRQMQSLNNEPFLISALHYTACVEAMRYIYQLSQADVNHLLELNGSNEVTLCRACGDLIKSTYNALRALESSRDKEMDLHIRLNQRQVPPYGENEGSMVVAQNSQSVVDGQMEVVLHVVHEPAPPIEREDKETMTDPPEVSEEVEIEDFEDEFPPTAAPPPTPFIQEDKDTMTDTWLGPLYMHIGPAERLRRYSTGDVDITKQSSALRSLLNADKATETEPLASHMDSAAMTDPLPSTTTEHMCWSCGEPWSTTELLPFGDDKATMTEPHVLVPVEDKEIMACTQHEDKSTMVRVRNKDEASMTTNESIDVGIDTSDGPWNRPPEPKRARISKATLQKLHNGLRANVTSAHGVDEESGLKIMNAFTLSETETTTEIDLTNASQEIITINDSPTKKRIKLEEPTPTPNANENEDLQLLKNPHCKQSRKGQKHATQPSRSQSPAPGVTISSLASIRCFELKLADEIKSPSKALLARLIKRISEELRSLGLQIVSLGKTSHSAGVFHSANTLTALESMILSARNIYMNFDECIATLKAFDHTGNFSGPELGATNPEPLPPVDVLANYFTLLLRMEPFLDISGRFWVALSMYKYRLIRIMKFFLESAKTNSQEPNSAVGLYESYFINICNCINNTGPEEHILPDVQITDPVPSYGAGVWTQIQAWNHGLDATAASVDHKVMGAKGFEKQIEKILAIVKRSRKS